MLKINSGQLDVFDIMIFESLIPKDHLLVKIDSVVDFSFVYDKVKDLYSDDGRGSKEGARACHGVIYLEGHRCLTRSYQLIGSSTAVKSQNGTRGQVLCPDSRLIDKNCSRERKNP